MTVYSMIQEGNRVDTPALTDAGPYDAVQWATMRAVAAGNGPYANYLNQLEVTNPSGTNIQVDTGGALVDGHFMDMDASLTFNVSAPGANSRIDAVVLVQNNTTSAVTQGVISGNDLIFPTDLTDYGGDASIEQGTCRPAILQGNQAASPVLPTLDTNSNGVYMVLLAQYEISSGGTISDFRDRRLFAASRMAGECKLRDVITANAQADVYFYNVPSTSFDRLVFRWQALVENNVGDPSFFCQLRDTTDTIINAFVTGVEGTDDGVTPTIATNGQGFGAIGVSDLTAASALAGWGRLEIGGFYGLPAIAGTTKLESSYAYQSSSGTRRYLNMAGYVDWDFSNALSTVRFSPGSGNWKNGSKFTMYGIR